MDLLARREHSLHELKEKLTQKFSRRSSESSFGHIRSHGHCVQVIDDQVDLESGGEPVDIPALENIIGCELDRLVEEKLQSDERFVESFINGRKSKGHGPQRILRDLSGRCVSSHLVNTYLNMQDGQWQELARQVYGKKFGEMPAADYKERAKRIRFMQQRGFPVWMFEGLL